ncbi:hypothetical protein Tco_1020800, partial [Tanacetum coccineum]
MKGDEALNLMGSVGLCLSEFLPNSLFCCHELFQGRSKGFDVGRALQARSFDFEEAISMVLYGINTLEEFHVTSTIRDVVGNIKTLLLFIQILILADGGGVFRLEDSALQADFHFILPTLLLIRKESEGKVLMPSRLKNCSQCFNIASVRRHVCDDSIPQIATASTTVNEEVEQTASIDGQAKTITEASLRRHMKLEDNGGISSLPNTEIFKKLALLGYATDSDKLTFQKGNFSQQWRFFIHTILHCLSPKKTSWEQFSSNIATAIIYLATNSTFNFLKFIFDTMVKNLDNPHKFLMYPRFIQIYLNKQKRLLQPHTRTYPTPILTQKVFSNMKQVTRCYSGEDIPLFPSMITAPKISPSRITSSPSLSPQHTPISAPSTSPPPITDSTPTAEEPAPMPHESPVTPPKSGRSGK